MFVETVKTALHSEACALPHWNGLQKGKTGHTGLLLVTTNEQSTAPGSTWGLTLTPGIDCLNHHIFRLFGRLGRYGGLYENHT